ncbi:MAG: macrolide ABC transporter ATP-binding protein [Candidatus Doudnabacteria bacterium RIFCSPHIGHO2_02_FULL_46_11]|uniref:Macrolide ABC transporter ATP-binding protein n=1 Tax=Candidatus Doudnabacteria bacterium RIFCSPHIGHO2_02_FULL_46_11 TaxID=1817832 RepID=A0A1F5P7Y3_9BACT|nr:MAG: macrolide ABC transporter ATP-binding protein [Candidatus Doudnabacteria bacterium RIFCSPHIGHO2_02_FULL_46_11]
MKDEAVISIRNISKDYFNGVKTTALRGVDLKINKGEFVAIMGPSGSGKSTLMHIVGLLDIPTSGSYRLAGKEVANLSPSEQAEVRNRDIGFVFQQFNLLPRTTVLDNILLPTIYNNSTGSKDRALEIINKVGLSDRVNHKSNQLSGGQIQRVAIARALMMNPHIILADEPTGNLDSKTSEEIMAVFQQINKEGTTIVMVTHEEDIASHAKRMVKLKDGLIISDQIRS